MKKQEHPNIQTKLNTGDYIWEAIALLSLLALIAIPIFFYSSLPNQIPVHYDFSGTPDRFGSKASLFALPAIGLFLYLLLTTVNKYPKLFSFYNRAKAEHFAYHYGIATWMTRAIKAIVLFGLAYINWGSVQTALGKWAGLSTWFLIVFLGSLFGVIGWYLYKANQHK